MKKSESNLIIGELFTIFFLLFDIFIKNILNKYLICLLLIVFLIYISFIIGIDRKRVLFTKKIIMYSIIITLSFLTIKYGIGLFTGFLMNPFNNFPMSMLKNSFSITVIIISLELVRYNIASKSNCKLILILLVILSTLIDVSLSSSLVGNINLREIIEIVLTIFIPSLSKNIMLTLITKKYAYYPCMIYSLIMNLYIYIIPIIPDFNEFMDAVWEFVNPIIIIYFINSVLSSNKITYKKNNLLNIIATYVLTIIIIVLVALNSNMFRFWIAVIATGSMTPTINVGDAVIVDKSVQKDLSKIREGDILVFQIKGYLYTHRIVKIDYVNNHYAILTQGDRVGNVIDNWVVTDENIIGIVKFKIPYIGYPTVWLNRLTKEL